MNSGPALVSILRQGDTLVASVHTALDDSEMVRFQHDLGWKRLHLLERGRCDGG